MSTPVVKIGWNGGFSFGSWIIRELKSHMISYKFKCSHWWRFALQSECCNFNQWEDLNFNRSYDFKAPLQLKLPNENPPDLPKSRGRPPTPFRFLHTFFDFGARKRQAPYKNSRTYALIHAIGLIRIVQNYVLQIWNCFTVAIYELLCLKIHRLDIDGFQLKWRFGTHGN